VQNNFSRTGLLLGLYLTFGSAVASGQTQRIDIFSNEQEYNRVFKDLPQADQLHSSFSLLEAHVDKALGAEFNEITSLTAIYCRKTTAINTMEKSISELLSSGMHFQILSDWDPQFGTLRASLMGRALINSKPPEFQRIKIKIQVSEAQHGQRAFIMDYEILSSPQETSRSWADVSSSTEARNYVDDLRLKIRARIEKALRDNCENATIRDIPSEEQAIQAMATKLKLKPADIEAVRAALGTQNE
jgi:hypothetical protein